LRPKAYEAIRTQHRNAQPYCTGESDNAMIRYVPFLEPDDGDFAFYDTITDTFVTCGGVQSWSSFEEFVEHCDDSKFIERVRGLMPNDQGNAVT